MGMAFPTENKGRWGDNHTWATIHDGRVCLAMWYLHPKMIRHSNFSKWVCAYRSQPIIFHQISRRLNIFVFHQEKVRILTPDGFWLMRMKEKHDATNFFVTSKNNHGDLPTKRSCINNNVQYIWGSNEVVGRFYFTYCGWKKSCTTLDGWNPINIGINHLSIGAGFCNHPPYGFSSTKYWENSSLFCSFAADTSKFGQGVSKVGLGSSQVMW